MALLVGQWSMKWPMMADGVHGVLVVDSRTAVIALKQAVVAEPPIAQKRPPVSAPRGLWLAGLRQGPDVGGALYIEAC